MSLIPTQYVKSVAMIEIANASRYHAIKAAVNTAITAHVSKDVSNSLDRLVESYAHWFAQDLWNFEPQGPFSLSEKLEFEKSYYDTTVEYAANAVSNFTKLYQPFVDAMLAIEHELLTVGVTYLHIDERKNEEAEPKMMTVHVEIYRQALFQLMLERLPVRTLIAVVQWLAVVNNLSPRARKVFAVHIQAQLSADWVCNKAPVLAKVVTQSTYHGTYNTFCWAVNKWANAQALPEFTSLSDILDGATEGGAS